MNSLKIICAKENEILFNKAKDYLLEKEQSYCALMNRILHKDKSVYVITENTNTVQGVFSYNSGHSFTAYIKAFTKEIKSQLKEFIKENFIFCITGEEEQVLEIEKIIYEVKKINPQDIREMYLMEFLTFDENYKPPFTFYRCSINDEEEIFPLQCAYSLQEVIPEWKEQNLALERMNTEKILRNEIVFGVRQDNKIVSKVNTNAITENYFQIGGIFTLEAYRGKGYARELVKYFSYYARTQNKKIVLYVRRKNESALKAYLKAGYTIKSNYRIVYYKD